MRRIKVLARVIDQVGYSHMTMVQLLEISA